LNCSGAASLFGAVDMNAGFFLAGVLNVAVGWLVGEEKSRWTDGRAISIFVRNTHLIN